MGLCCIKTSYFNYSVVSLRSITFLYRICHWVYTPANPSHPNKITPINIQGQPILFQFVSVKSLNIQVIQGALLLLLGLECPRLSLPPHSRIYIKDQMRVHP